MTPPQPTFCLHCGYNLHGLPSEGKCPECGAATAIQKQRAVVTKQWQQNWLTLDGYPPGFVMLLDDYSLHGIANCRLMAGCVAPAFVALLLIGIGQMFTVRTAFDVRWEDPDDSSHVYSYETDYEELHLIGDSRYFAGYCIAPPGIPRREVTDRAVGLVLEPPGPRAALFFFALPVSATCGALLFSARLHMVIAGLRKRGIPVSTNIVRPALSLLAPIGAATAVLAMFAVACEVTGAFAYETREMWWSLSSVTIGFAWVVWALGGSGVVIAVFRNCAPAASASQLWLAGTGALCWLTGICCGWVALTMVFAAFC